MVDQISYDFFPDLGLSTRQKICLPSFNGFHVVSLEEVLYCEASSCYTNFVLTGNRKLCVSKPLLDYESILGDNFTRIHKSYLVNVHHITGYLKGDGGTVIMADGTRLEVSRRKKDMFLQKMKTMFKY